jgi:DNA-nicking Smr family endonuclease
VTKRGSDRGRTSGGDDDALAFAEAMRGAKPLPAAVRGPLPAAPRSPGASPGRGRIPARPQVDAYEAPAEGLTQSSAFAVVTTGGSIEGRGRGVDAKLLRRLKAGELPVEARLDLHGHARADALDALERFFESARAAGKRCLLVIHGRGAHSRDDAPVLKPLVWRWLAASPSSASAVLAFASARPGQGGDGATLVLLRKPGR